MESRWESGKWLTEWRKTNLEEENVQEKQEVSPLIPENFENLEALDTEDKEGEGER